MKRSLPEHGKAPHCLLYLIETFQEFCDRSNLDYAIFYEDTLFIFSLLSWKFIFRIFSLQTDFLGGKQVRLFLLSVGVLIVYIIFKQNLPISNNTNETRIKE